MKVVTYLINLEGSDERLKNATEILSSQDVEFIRFPAVDGRGKALTEFKDYNDEKAKQVMGRSLLNAEIGCYLSHIGCIHQFLASDADYLIVLEDDMVLENDYKKTIYEVISYLDKNNKINWNVINIGPKKKKFFKKLNNFNGYELLRVYYFPIRTIGLVWSRKGAQEFLEQGSEIFMPIDNYLQYWLSRNSKGLSIWKPLVKPSGFESVIDKNRSKKKYNSLYFSMRKQIRTWKTRFIAINNMVINKNGNPN
ncbi:glycosyltransferase family 25 protein [Acinetobacter indicus]|uniref:Glycosyl transferase family 25 domain-containing protein n=1 Tax=Acinetobacter indicus CIP 110367 TaxID=1341679 RepID=V2UG18_9GAMM|nr:glycosyltransferase family 25 protein [Acinetobacter indicus]EPF73673.1 hypothetical protein F956_00832 [Acinetobacter indicus ANC 4215]ESK47585.1 hypothetical protein P253_02200 [Acinetobacter indicus CIP 110367]MDM1491451.1 glycosyltransferase family 25 protein [Acinetobacter indicus]